MYGCLFFQISPKIGLSENYRVHYSEDANPDIELKKG